VHTVGSTGYDQTNLASGGWQKHSGSPGPERWCRPDPHHDSSVCSSFTRGGGCIVTVSRSGSMAIGSLLDLRGSQVPDPGGSPRPTIREHPGERGTWGAGVRCQCGRSEARRLPHRRRCAPSCGRVTGSDRAYTAAWVGWRLLDSSSSSELPSGRFRRPALERFFWRRYEVKRGRSPRPAPPN